MSYNYFKNNAFLNSGGSETAVNYKSLDAIKSSGVTDLSAPSPQMLYDVDYEAVNTLFNTYDQNTAQSTVTAGLKNAISGAKVWATPVYNAAFENLVGTTTTTHGDLQNTGEFERNVIDNETSNPIQPSNFPGLTKGCLWFAMSFWAPGSTFGAPTHFGTIYMNFPELQATGSNGIRSLLYPIYNRRVEAFIVYGNYHAGNLNTFENGYTETYSDVNSRWCLSTAAYSIGNSGYYFPTAGVFRISANDGIWGFKTNSSINGHDGTNLSSFSGSTKSFGIQNYNSNDSSVDDLYWGVHVKASTSLRGVIWTVTT